MIDEDKLNKTVTYISSANTSNIFQSVNFEFNHRFVEPIKNALYIKIMRTEVFLNPKNHINGNDVVDGDPIFVVIDNYHRMTINIDGNNVKCFEYVLLNLSEKFGGNDVPNKVVSFKTEYTSPGCHANDVNIITLNPVEPTLAQFNIHLYDKNFNIIPKTAISKFAMTICVYHSRKKTTQY
jgi:hypothetical protein